MTLSERGRLKTFGNQFMSSSGNIAEYFEKINEKFGRIGVFYAA
jgi:hypothetical protein